jgi:hypothetical protein
VLYAMSLFALLTLSFLHRRRLLSSLRAAGRTAVRVFRDLPLNGDQSSLAINLYNAAFGARVTIGKLCRYSDNRFRGNSWHRILDWWRNDGVSSGLLRSRAIRTCQHGRRENSRSS